MSKVELLGSNVAMTFSQTAQGLTVTPGGTVSALTGITNQQLASKMRVLRITHDKGWINDDDPGSASPGWLRTCNLGTGDYNNDLTTSDTAGPRLDLDVHRHRRDGLRAEADRGRQNRDSDRRPVTGDGGSVRHGRTPAPAGGVAGDRPDARAPTASASSIVARAGGRGRHRRPLGRRWRSLSRRST